METLTAASYAIVTCADNVVTTVTSRRHNLIMLEWLDPQREDISHTALGLDHTWRTGIDLELAPQPQHLHVNASIENILVNAGGLQQLFSRERPLRRLEKGQQQSVLALAQRARLRIGIEQFPATPLELPAIEPVSASLRLMGTCDASHFLPPQHGTDTGKQFPEAEWLDNVVVRAEFEADDAIDFVRAMPGGDDHRNVRMRTNFPQHIQPVILPEPQIQNDQAGNCPGKMTIELCPV